MTKSRKCFLANCMLATLVRALLISCVTIFLAGSSLALNVNESVSIGINSNCLCLCVICIILTSECLNTCCCTSRSSSNFTCIPCVTCSRDFLCVCITASASEGLYALGFTAGSCCNLAFVVGVCMVKAGDNAIFAMSTNGAIAVLCAVSILGSGGIFNPFAPCMITNCRNCFLCNDSFAANGAVRAFGKACLCAAGSLCLVNNYCVTKSIAIRFTTNFANCSLRAASCATTMLMLAPFAVNGCVLIYRIRCKVPQNCEFGVFIPTCKIVSISCWICRLGNKLSCFNILRRNLSSFNGEAYNVFFGLWVHLVKPIANGVAARYQRQHCN